ncbi:MAG: hypothetical protein KTR30_38680 [Saprospiraceae bacterium]|nr:hypothetical protein [Saprospiraceae bacterium]
MQAPFTHLLKKVLPIFFLLAAIFFLNSPLAYGQAAKSNIPSGEIKGPFSWTSNIYPGTERNYWIYVPQQYDPNKAACSMVVQDGLGRAKGWRLPQVLDSLIAAKTIPVVIGIFVDHGKVAPEGLGQHPRYNRSFEYDGLGDRYARFLLEELLPEVGKTYNLSTDPNDRSIAGASSGGICAFNAAWERPDAFSRVLSTIGTYVGLRGGDEFHSLVRKSEPKPIRVFLEDGNTDLNIYAGDWWMANQTMLRALTWAGYEVQHKWGTEGHNSNGARKIMGEALSWLWQDYPSRVDIHWDQYQGLKLMDAESKWKPLGQGAHQIAVNRDGEVFFTDKSQGRLYQLESSTSPRLVKAFSFRLGAMAFDRAGRLFLANLDRKQIVRLDQNGKLKKVLKKVEAADLLATEKGLYFTETNHKRIGFYAFADQSLQYFPIDKKPLGLSLSADQTFLKVTMEDDVLGHSFRLGQKGQLEFGQSYVHYHIPYGEMGPGAAGIAVDSDNQTYTATKMGIQVADQLGRINFIFTQAGNRTSQVAFGGPALDQLYTICDGQLLVRSLIVKGALPFLAPIQPPKPGL